MFKQIFSYTDFDGNQATETLHFNITQHELGDNLDLEAEAKKVYSFYEENTGELSEERNRAQLTKILSFLKRLIKLSYGIRSEDGKRFIKTDQVYTEFTQTAVYDEYLFSFFKNPDAIIDFINGVMPKNLVEEATRLQAEQAKQQTAQIAATDKDDNRPAWEREGRMPRQEELETMSTEEIKAAFVRATAR